MFGKSKLKLTGRAGLIYKNDGRTMLIDSEMLGTGEYDMVIYERSMKAWQAPHDGEVVTEEEKQRIKEDIQTHMKKCRIDWQG
jgi:hypothetical protein